MDATAEIKSFIQSELQLLAQEFIKQRVAALQSRKIVASGDLKNSMEFEIINQAKGEAIEMLLAFEEHGRYIDMRTLKPPTNFGNPYISLIEEWIRKRGWEQKFTDKFMANRPHLRKVPKNVLNQIAWGIAVKRGNGKYRRKKWWNASKTAFISDTFNQIAAGIPDIAAKTIKEAFL
jgi:hypothetical protein